MNHAFAPRARRLTAQLLAGITALLAAASACAQQDGHAAAPSSEGADSILQRANNGRTQGSQSARLTVVEISDFQCPYCRAFFDSTYRKFDSAYVQTGKVRMMYVNLPLPMHPQAFAAAKTAMCAAAQGKFWPMHDKLFSSQREWGGQTDAAQRFAKYAQDLGLNMPAYHDCVDNDRTAPLILNDVMQASGAGVNGTPTFVINGRLLSGALPFSELSQQIDAALNGGPAAPQGTPPATPAPPSGTPPKP
jgi:protein-disulfide isomerase